MNFDQLHWVPEETKQALSKLRAERRHIAELKTDLADFLELAWFGAEHQRAWARTMAKSIQHELHQLGEEV